MSSNEGSEIITITKKYKGDVMKLFRFYLRSFIILRKLRKQKKLDVVVGTGLSAFGGMLFSKIYRVPGVYNLSGTRDSEIQIPAHGIGISCKSRARRVA